MSTLEEGSRDPIQNYGFVVTWRNARQDTRVTSYSIGNSIDPASPPASPGLYTFSQLSPPGSSQRQASFKNARLSRILSNAVAPVLNSEVTFAAFKALPIDPARGRRESGSFYEPADELTGATNCKEATELMVDAIYRACVDVRGAQDEFIKDEEVVRFVLASLFSSPYRTC